MPVKLTTTAEGERKRKRKKTSKRIYRVSQNIINVFLESLLSESFPSLGLTVHLSSLGAPQHRAGLWVCCGAAQVLTWSCPSVLLPPVAPAVRTGAFLWWERSAPVRLPQTQRLLGGSCGFNLQLVQPGGKVGVFLLSPAAPGFQLWFYFHLCMWVVHWGLLLRLPWRAWVCPWEGQLWRWCSCLGRRGSGSTRYSGELAARAAGNREL